VEELHSQRNFDVFISVTSQPKKGGQKDINSKVHSTQIQIFSRDPKTGKLIKHFKNQINSTP